MCNVDYIDFFPAYKSTCALVTSKCRFLKIVINVLAPWSLLLSQFSSLNNLSKI